ncbi:MAG: hypothetical protein CMJ77_14415 [Planctomycetaceae bacterium]|nr:hypothetical protein [Planctomycetaceae bacterium]
MNGSVYSLQNSEGRSSHGRSTHHIASAVAGIGSLIYFILVIVHLFKTEQTGLGIAYIVLIFVGSAVWSHSSKVGWMGSGPSCGSGRRVSSWGYWQTLFFDAAGGICSLPRTASPLPRIEFCSYLPAAVDLIDSNRVH